jgi:hypothetical protein
MPPHALAWTQDAVSKGAPLLAVLGFIILPLIWSVPEALVTAGAFLVCWLQCCCCECWRNPICPFARAARLLLHALSSWAPLLHIISATYQCIKCFTFV